PLKHAPPGRPLRRLGTAGPVRRRNAGRVPDTALAGQRRTALGLGAVRRRPAETGRDRQRPRRTGRVRWPLDPPVRASPEAMPGTGQEFNQASRSALIVSAWVVGMPCGNPLYV